MAEDPKAIAVRGGGGENLPKKIQKKNCLVKKNQSLQSPNREILNNKKLPNLPGTIGPRAVGPPAPSYETKNSRASGPAARNGWVFNPQGRGFGLVEKL